MDIDNTLNITHYFAKKLNRRIPIKTLNEHTLVYWYNLFCGFLGGYKNQRFCSILILMNFFLYNLAKKGCTRKK